MTYLFIALLALTLTGCDRGTVTAEHHGDMTEGAVMSEYTGSLTREVTGNGEESISFRVKLSRQNGHILLTITDRDGDVCLSLNEHATLDENGTMVVTAPLTGQPYVLQADMERFSGAYEVSWTD